MSSVNVLDLLQSGNLVKISAPMVRYSKLPFRLTVKEYGADVCYTPMIMADSFIHSAYARDLELQLSSVCPPTIVQFAAHNAHEFASAVELVAPYVSGVDLNCGCPQTWATEEGIGASLMRDPQLIKEMVSQARSRAGSTPVSVKIRVFQEKERTVELARTIEAAGAAWITVHGRTRKQRSSEPVDYEMIRLVRESVSIPVVANGSIDSLEQAQEITKQTGVHGVMTARALLENPALFAGHKETPWECIDTFIKHSLDYGTSSPIFQHHLSLMTSSILQHQDSRILNSLSNASVPTLLDFMTEMRTKYNP